MTNIRKILLCWLVGSMTLAAQAQTKELGKLAEAGTKATRKGQFELADSLFGTYVSEFQQKQLPKNFQYSEILIYLARRASQAGQTDKAIQLQQEVVEIRKTAPDCTFTQWASAMSDLASFYSQKGDYTKAIEVGQQSLKMLRKKLGTNHQFYNIALANQASFYSSRGNQGDFEVAVQLGEGAVNNLKKGTPEYANALNALVVYYSQVGDLISANTISEKARQEAKKRLEEDGISYATVLNNQAIHLANVGNYDEAIEFARQAKESFEQAGSTGTLAYGKLLTNMATFLTHQQNFQEAVNLLETALQVIEKSVGKQHTDYLRCMSELAAVYKTSGNLAKADELANESNSVSLSLGADDNAKYAKSLSKQAAVFASNGNYLRAIEHEQKAYEVFQRRDDKVGMAQSLGHLATYLANDGKQELAFKTARQALAIFQNEGKSVYHAQSLNNTALLYFNGEQYATAVQYGRQARQMYEELGDTATAIYARILSNNALFSFVCDSLEQAVATAQQALGLQLRLLGDEHPDQVPLLYNLAVYKSKAGANAEAESYYQQALKLQSDQIRTDFLHLTSQEREKFWSQKSYIFKYAPMLAYLDRQSGQMATLAYNSLLFSKSILLNSDIDFRNLIKASGDKDLFAKYSQMESLQQQLEGYYRQPPEQRRADPKKIKEEIYTLERTLVRGCKEYGDFTENLNIDADRLCRQLNDDEVAIEFTDIYIQGQGNTYLALLLRKDQPRPTLIRLFCDEELRQLKYGDDENFFDALQLQSGIDKIYSDQRLGQMLWQPILRELSGVRHIYFSPTSLFYQLGIEYLPCDASHRIYDLFEVHRVSSTKLLANRQSAAPSVKSATVYGGLNYDMTLSQLQEQKALVPTSAPDHLLAQADTGFDGLRALDSLTLRGSVGFLPGTLHEAESVGEQLMQNDIATNMLTGNEGTEDAFKALSGTRQSVIHIATHGFYFSAQDLKRRNQRLLFLNEQTEDLRNPLNYAGLLMSGANYVLTGGKLPDNLENGILTANEIAQTDLSQTDLVVLSACQTGVGEILEDGVFGIQRGFKKAGARSLLMSLWSISDAATDLMMTHFYQNLTKGMTRQQAFQAAQETLRNGKYAAPFYWASFILLDGF